MKHAVLMPALGETMDEGSIVAWRKGTGDAVAQGEVLFEVMTDKATFEVEAAQAGYVRAILVKPDQTVAVGETVAWLTDTADEAFEVTSDTPQTPPVQEEAAGAGEPASPRSSDKRFGSHGVRVSPKARRLLEQHQIPVELIAAHIPGRPIEAADVEAYLQETAESQGTATPPSTVIPLSGMRTTIARRMTKTTEVPQVTLHAHSVVDRLLDRHRQVKERSGLGQVTLTDWVIKAAATALGRHPTLNAWFRDNAIEQFAVVNVGMAVDTTAGLVVPVIRDVKRLTLGQIATERIRLKELALAGRLAVRDVSDGTFTVSNLGGYGVESFTPLLNLPEVGILGVGRIVSTVAADGGRLYSEQRLALSLTFDHRAVDGGPAAAFLAEISQLLSDLPPGWV